ncbi:MAG: hypothetical protein L0219_20090 [Phycisphaerales bacterium]|nr:hypothetical protein [Phycisphaerales bacterium]MCI0674149.1 hypothetical protein [Phycisphaerales bacterium]
MDQGRIRRLDRECEARQEKRIQELKLRTERFNKEEQARRKALLENLDKWRQARDLREYLTDVRRGVAKRYLRITDAVQHCRWMDWARWYADELDPNSKAGPSPFQPIRVKRAVIPTADLDLTSHTRAVVEQLRVPDSDALFELKPNAVKAVTSHSSAAWNEICRLLEGLGYDIGARKG